jgi:DHA1 family tetracycline resistance protein-like MFS transporter
MLPLALSGGVLNTVLQSAVTKSVSQEEVGGILGIAGSLEAISRVVAPSVGGFLIQQVSLSAPGIFSAVIMVWVVSFAYRRIILPDHRDRMQAETEASQA